jgi:hypothetical protein
MTEQCHGCRRGTSIAFRELAEFKICGAVTLLKDYGVFELEKNVASVRGELQSRYSSIFKGESYGE